MKIYNKNLIRNDGLDLIIEKTFYTKIIIHHDNSIRINKQPP